MNELCKFVQEKRQAKVGIRAQDYKEKDKFDSKQISDSAFGAHLSFCQNIGDYKAF